MRIHGWTTTASPRTTVQSLLGPATMSKEVPSAVGVWRVGDALAPEHPIGPIRSIVLFEATDDRAEVEIIPGSQGLERPPEEPGHAVIRSKIVPLRTLMLDARCWYRILDATGLKCTIWMLTLAGESNA